MKAIVDAQMELDDETSAYQLHRLLLFAWIHDLSSHHPTLPLLAGLDVPRERVLPAHSTRHDIRRPKLATRVKTTIFFVVIKGDTVSTQRQP